MEEGRTRRRRRNDVKQKRKKTKRKWRKKAERKKTHEDSARVIRAPELQETELEQTGHLLAHLRTTASPLSHGRFIDSLSAGTVFVIGPLTLQNTNMIGQSALKCIGNLLHDLIIILISILN